MTALLLFTAGCHTVIPGQATYVLPAYATYPGAYWPTEGWRTADPELQGMDGGLLASMTAAVIRRGLPIDSLLVVRHGYLVSEVYFGGDQPSTLHDQYSVTKSFIGTLIGIALDRGLIESTGQQITAFFPGADFSNPDPRKQKMTVANLLTMTSGLDWQEGTGTYGQMYASADWVQFVLGKRLAADPGGQFQYCSGCSHILSAILQRTAPGGTLAFAHEALFDPLGIHSVAWATDTQGIPIGGWGMQITPRDMAKLGYLYLHMGGWGGKQIVSADWVRDAVQSHIDAGGGFGYGYQWWVYPPDGAYAAQGQGGQMIIVVPGSDLVFVTTAHLTGTNDLLFQLLEQYVLPAVKK